jgi:hypothetical protein
MSWLKSRLVEVRERPFLAVLAASLIVVMVLRTSAQNGSRWDSILAGAAWILVVACAVVALLGGSRGDKSVDE